MDATGILKMEGENRNCIYLHREGAQWYAYESSAFYLNSGYPLKRGVEVVIDGESKRRLVRIALDKQPKDFFRGCELVAHSEDIMVVRCRRICGGFRYWKSRLTN